jgi:hypothetical protein
MRREAAPRTFGNYTLGLAQLGSMPIVLITTAASGVPRKLISAFDASGRNALGAGIASANLTEVIGWDMIRWFLRDIRLARPGLEGWVVRLDVEPTIR